MKHAPPKPRFWPFSFRWERLTGWARSPIYGVVVTVLLVFTGLLGSVYSAEIKRAWPLVWHLPQTYSGFSPEALAFWLSLLVTASVFYVRQLVRDYDQEEATNRLEGSSAKLLQAVQTMPPPGFLSQFGEIYSQCERQSRELVDQATAEDRHQSLQEAVRVVLYGIATLVKAYDADPVGDTYSANIMVVLDPSSLSGGHHKALRERLVFAEKATDVALLYRVLDLRTDLSASTLTSNGLTPPHDTSLKEIAFGLPQEPQINTDDPSRMKWKVLPGAPMAFFTPYAEFVPDTSLIGEWCRQEGDFRAEIVQKVENYFASKDEPLVGSFFSQALTQDEDRNTDTPYEPVAILNVHRSRPGICKGRDEAKEQLVLVTRPFRILLMRQLGLLLEDERSSSDTNTRIVKTSGTKTALATDDDPS